MIMTNDGKWDERDKVSDVARESRQEIREDARDAIQAVNEDFREFKRSQKGSDSVGKAEVQIMREAKKYAKQDIRQDRRDGLDSIDDIQSEYLYGDISAKRAISEMVDVAEETEFEMDKDIY